MPVANDGGLLATWDAEWVASATIDYAVCYYRHVVMRVTIALKKSVGIGNYWQSLGVLKPTLPSPVSGNNYLARASWGAIGSFYLGDNSEVLLSSISVNPYNPDGGNVLNVTFDYLTW
jgi:hypothetical protein